MRKSEVQINFENGKTVYTFLSKKMALTWRSRNCSAFSAG